MVWKCEGSRAPTLPPGCVAKDKKKEHSHHLEDLQCKPFLQGKTKFQLEKYEEKVVEIQLLV